MSTQATAGRAAGTYRIVSRVHVNSWSDDLQRAVPGWDIRALWLKTGTTLPVFVPDTSYSDETVDALIRHLGAVDESVHALGG